MITVDFILENKDKWEEYREEINKFTKKIIIDLIIEDPDTIHVIDLDKIDGEDISYILKTHPDLIKDLKPYLDRISGHGIHWILKYHPGLIRDLKSYLDKLNKYNIYYVLIYQPKLIKDLKPYLNKLDGQQRSNILEKKPGLSLLFKYLNTEYEDAAYYYTCPSEIFKLDKEEKYKLSKKMVELIRKEKR